MPARSSTKLTTDQITMVAGGHIADQRLGGQLFV